MIKENKIHTHWIKHPPHEIAYGKHRFGTGCYRIKGGTVTDYWLDQEIATDREKRNYNSWLKANGYEEINITSENNNETRTDLKRGKREI